MEILLGVIVSCLVQWLKSLTPKMNPLVWVVVLALIGGASYYYLNLAGMWESFYQILVTAGAFYAFILRNLKGVLKLK